MVKTLLMLKLPIRTPEQVVYIITKSPPEQYSNSSTKIEKVTDEIEHLNKYENGVGVFDYILASSKGKYIDLFS